MSKRTSNQRKRASGDSLEVHDNQTASCASVTFTQRRPAKKRKTQANESLQVTRVRRKGALKVMLDMPLDILFEIFGNMHPQDLMNLSRTTKDFRALLIHKSSARFWKAAFENALDLPPCYPNMNELAFANLLFSTHCHVCLKPNVNDVLWGIRARYCKDCKDERLFWSGRFASLDRLEIVDISSPAKPYLSVIRKETLKKSSTDEGYIVDRNEIAELKARWKDVDFDDEESVKRALLERQKYMQEVELVAMKCQEWYQLRRRVRSGKLEILRQTRYKAIIKKLREAGYDEEIDKCSNRTREMLLNEKAVREPKVLTDRAWENLKSKAISIMEGIRKNRVFNERRPVLQARMEPLIPVLNSLRRDYGDINFPSSANFLLLPPVRSIIDVPNGVTLTAEDIIRSIKAILPEILADWKSSVQVKLVQLIKSKTEVPEGVDPLSLAVGSFFRCIHCGKFRSYEHLSPYMFKPLPIGYVGESISYSCLQLWCLPTGFYL
ncbi:hypothetical protein C8Q75DRAFT_428862 [Abortiporus biennis]|nr:hypothetical protein C8Q75DRAFT_428862 [Abortiporus biennis]